jgi:hypothetical protein
MIRFILKMTDDPDVLELRASAIGGDTAAKPPFIVRGCVQCLAEAERWRSGRDR